MTAIPFNDIRFALWSIDDSRKHYKDKILDTLTFRQEFPQCLNGKKDDLIFNIPDQSLTPGELGVWNTFINTLELIVDKHIYLVTFEDDALLNINFMDEFLARYDFLPDNFDFFSLFIPRDHDYWSEYEPEIDELGTVVDPFAMHHGEHGHRVNYFIYKPWQRYGGVSMLWSPTGASKVLELIKKNVYGQWDEFVYCNSRLGNLDGYTSNPRLSDLVYISGTELSLVHE